MPALSEDPPISTAPPAPTSPPVALPTRLPSLTGLRFIAAALVFAFHTLFALGFVTGPAAGPVGDAVFRGGSYGVGFFFVLSGFVLTWTFRPDRPRAEFVRERLAKIVPNHLVTFVAAIVLAVAAGTALGLRDWLPNVLLLQAWWPTYEVVTSANSVSWSLSCELLFYLAFPFLIVAINRIRARHLWAAVALVAVLCAVVALVGQFMVSDQPRLPFPRFTSISFTQMWFVYYFPPTRLLDFVLGILLARIVLSGRWPRIGMAPATAIAVIGYVVATRSPYLFGVGGLASLWVAPLIAAAARSDVRVTYSPVRGAFWTWLGDTSFALYMVHALVLIEVRQALGPDWDAPLLAELLVVVGCLAVSLVLAWLLNVLVEQPVMRWVRTRRKRPLPAHLPG